MTVPLLSTAKDQPEWLTSMEAVLGISHDHIIYLGDGSSDLPVMMHVN
jgi:3-deoxy-D-manno-octulosonate 8-phosphate phosphatase KdsC-like HAD superfamily phosphatase